MSSTPTASAGTTTCVRSTRVGDAGAEETLLHEWIVGGKTVHSALMTYTMTAGATFAARSRRRVGRAASKGGAARGVAALQLPRVDVPPRGVRRLPRSRQRPRPLGAPTILGFFERQRTTLIGGQDELERLKAEDQVMIVMYSIQQLRFLPTAVRPREKIVVSSGFA